MDPRTANQMSNESIQIEKHEIQDNLTDLHAKAAVQLARDSGCIVPDQTRMIISMTCSPNPWSPDSMKVKPLALAVWTRDTENVNLRPLAAKGSMKTNSMSIGHTKLKDNYTVECSSVTGIIAFGTSNAWLARQPS
eukprot:16439953-Heterocapsa_arctica.AAC.3